MLKKIFFLFLFASIFSFGQHTIKGTLDTKESYPWMLAYKLNGSKQEFVTYDSIKKGSFQLNLSDEQKKGVYRLIFDVQNRRYFDVFYDNEDIELSFNPNDVENTLKFSASKNNILYHNYGSIMSVLTAKLDSLQVAYFNSARNNNNAVLSKYKEQKASYDAMQEEFEKQSQDLFVYDFIKSSKRSYSDHLIKYPSEYLSFQNNHFFDHVDFNNPTLSNSTFLHDKINEFIFQLNNSDDQETLRNLRKQSIAITLSKLNNNPTLSQDVQEGLLYNFAQMQDVDMTNYLLNYYSKLPKQNQDLTFINDIKGQLRTAIGNVAPNILWNENGQQQALHTLKGSSYYLVLFWSSTCGHCLKELPQLANFLKNRSDIKVVAVGLETEQSKSGWKAEITKYTDWLHVYGKDKWKNKYAKEYGVNSTPSFYLLGATKKIVAKPDDIKELGRFFSKK